ncbi:LuxR C-terminal-related transcriptional regulator [Microbispora sp. NPDC049125]|uniref:helix-turn-helix transcriptional regulator n=1 Tax=Microbispora sp. NPDC049125 TaxID=3154929 RepID=UPI0034668B7F
MAASAFVRQVGNLPADLTSFVGRRQELAEIRHLLSVSRLLTLVGVGGVGKTRLALRAAADQHRAFDAVWLVDLTSLDDPALVAETVAATLGVRDDYAASPLDALTKFLAARRTLLVLDNCEHLGDACGTLAHRLLRAAPDLRILATSRQSLGITGEHQMKVEPLAVPEPDGPLTVKAVEMYDGVGLFVERAAAVVHGFSLTRDNQAAVVELCRRLDGIPLAIELAAVRLRALSVGALVERLSDRYACLTGGSRAAMPRQQTLHALVDWSYQLLSPPERVLWTRMSIFPSHFDLDAAETVCSGDGIEREYVLDLIDNLLDKSLLVREEYAGEVRYRMLETLREFGRRRLSGPDEHRTLRRHRDWCMLLLDRAAAEWFGPRQSFWFPRLGLERGNFRAALEFCLLEAGEAETGLRMATCLYETYWVPHAFYAEGRHWFGRLLPAAPEPTAARARALCAAAELAFTQGDIEAGELLIGEGRTLAAKLGDAMSMGRASLISGIAAHYTGDHARAAVLLQETLDGPGAGCDPVGTVVALITLASTAGFLGDTERAEELFERSLTMVERYGESWIRPWVLTVVAVHAWRAGDNARAMALARESLLVGRPLDDRLAVMTGIEALAWFLADEGHHVEAARMIGAVEQAGRTAGLHTRQHEQFLKFHEQCVALLRRELGETAFARATRQGGRLTLEQAVAEAIGARPAEAEDAPAAEAPPSAPSALSPLTAREREIAELIAGGLSNKEIASTLVIAQRTTEGHVEHILTKLGFSSRTQIASWVTARKAVEENRRRRDPTGTVSPPHHLPGHGTGPS